MRANESRSHPLRTGRVLRGGLLALEEKPLAIVLVAAGATIVVSYLLAASAGLAHIHRVVYAQHSWAWLTVCLAGETLAYVGYVLTLRDIARVDRGPEMDLAASAQTVVAGFGVFAATRGSGGFAVDYWALRREGAGRRDAVGRVLALGFLEYATLSIVALLAAIALYARVTAMRAIRRRSPPCSRSRPSQSRSGPPRTSARSGSAVRSRTGAGSGARSQTGSPGRARRERFSRARESTGSVSSG
jgi:hypothetical protein